MPVTTSAKKALRQTYKHRAHNIEIKRGFKEAVKRLEKALAGQEKDAVPALLQDAYKKIDKAAKANVIHKNAAARQKSRLQRAINKGF